MAQTEKYLVRNYWNGNINTNGIQAVTGAIMNTGGVNIIDSAAWYDEIIPYDSGSTLNNGDILVYNGVNYVPTGQSFISKSLDDLSDVAITSVFSGQTLYYDGTEWINQLPQDFPDASKVKTISIDKPSYLSESITSQDTSLLITTINSGGGDYQVNMQTSVDNLTDDLMRYDDPEIQIGNTVDYVAISESGITLNGDATVWEDQQININSIRLAGVSDPSYDAWKGSRVLTFAQNASNIIYFNTQLSHQYKEGSDLEFHIHYAPAVSVATENINTYWEFTYSAFPIGAVAPAETTINVVLSVGDTADKHLVNDVATISGVINSLGISSMVYCSLSRLGNNGNDTYTYDVYLLGADFHYEIDTLGGSREEYSK